MPSDLTCPTEVGLVRRKPTELRPITPISCVDYAQIVPGLAHDSTSDSTSQKRLYQRAQKCALQARRAGRAGPKLTQQEKPFSGSVEDNFHIDVSMRRQ